MYFFSVSLHMLFLLEWKSSLPESFKTYLSVSAHFDSKILVIILQPSNLGALTVHKKWCVLSKNMHYGFLLQLQGE